MKFYYEIKGQGLIQFDPTIEQLLDALTHVIYDCYMDDGVYNGIRKLVDELGLYSEESVLECFKDELSEYFRENVL